MPFTALDTDFHHPALGAVINDYRVVAKLGQGTHGSLWLVVKISRRDDIG